jgi:8-oxo-dGTP pyrophosphatase MutT (NUDIX family)
MLAPVSRGDSGVRQKALVWIFRAAREGPDALLLERTPVRGGGLHPVTGKGDPGELPKQIAAREAEEETGLVGELVDLDHQYEYFGRKGSRFLESAFLMKAPAGAEPRLCSEHCAYRWVPAIDADALLQWATHRTTLRLALKAWGETGSR